MAYPQSSTDPLFTFLREIGLSRTMADKVCDETPVTLAQLRANPYDIFHYVEELNFHRIDRKIMAAGLAEPNNPYRVGAASEYVLQQSANKDGHTYLSLSAFHRELRNYSREYPITVPIDEVVNLFPQEVVHLAGDRVALASLRDDERYISSTLMAMSAVRTGVKHVPAPKKSLNNTQEAGVDTIVRSSVSLMTGGPGCGKTYTIQGVIDALGSRSNVCLCAPTGKAAKRMTEATGMGACTIHSLIIQMKDGLRDFDTLIIDESSMVNVELMANLLRTVKPTGKPPLRILMVGDNDQLPAIGAGRLFGDLLDSGLFPTVRLTEIMRQAEGSAIIRNAANIRQGLPLEDSAKKKDPERDSFVSLNLSVDKQKKMLLDGIKAGLPRLAKHLGRPVNPMKDILVIVPQHKGEMGCANLNRLLQDTLNPPSPRKGELETGAGESRTVFREGDKVIVTKNIRDLDVVNGEIGFVERANDDGGWMAVNFEDERKRVVFSPDYLQHVKHGYAITVHKSQGSEAPIVIAVFGQEAPNIMRNRNLLYTAVTRAKGGLWVIGTTQTIDDCIANNRPSIRHTMLPGFLEEASAGKRLPAGTNPELNFDAGQKDLLR